jgi:hypothetical protein
MCMDESHWPFSRSFLLPRRSKRRRKPISLKRTETCASPLSLWNVVHGRNTYLFEGGGGDRQYGVHLTPNCNRFQTLRVTYHWSSGPHFATFRYSHYRDRRQASSVRTVTRLRAGRSATWIRFPGKKGMGFFSSPPCPDPSSLLSTGYRELFRQEVKWPGRECDESLPSSAEVKNVWSLNEQRIRLHGVALS